MCLGFVVAEKMVGGPRAELLANFKAAEADSFSTLSLMQLYLVDIVDEHALGKRMDDVKQP